MLKNYIYYHDESIESDFNLTLHLFWEHPVIYGFIHEYSVIMEKRLIHAHN